MGRLTQKNGRAHVRERLDPLLATVGMLEADTIFEFLRDLLGLMFERVRTQAHRDNRPGFFWFPLLGQDQTRIGDIGRQIRLDEHAIAKRAKVHSVPLRES